jgi:hypothetical protein
MADTEAPVRILYIAGAGRSGSTLLDRVLGQLDGVQAFSEILKLWHHSNRIDLRQLCACGAQLQECPFWMEVMEEGFGGMDRFDPDQIGRLQSTAVRHRALLKLFLTKGSSNKALQEYLDHLGRLYRAIYSVSGARVIVDSSKTVLHARMLSRIPGFKVDLLHLVRDSRAVAFSWQRKKKRPDVTWEEAYMPRVGASKVAQRWIVQNLTAHLYSMTGGRRLFVRYEDFANDPRATLKRIAKWIDEDPAQVDKIFDGDTIKMKPGHSAMMGNPGGFKASVAIQPDRSWEEQMDRKQRRKVTLRTWPLLKLYRY